MASRNRMDNLKELKATDELKFVVTDRLDYEWAKDLILKHDLTKVCPVSFSPVWDQIDFADLAEWILDDGLPVKMQSWSWGLAPAPAMAPPRIALF